MTSISTDTPPGRGPTLTIRKLDPVVIDALRARARRAGRSTEEEVRLILTNAVQPSAEPTRFDIVDDLPRLRRAADMEQVTDSTVRDLLEDGP